MVLVDVVVGSVVETACAAVVGRQGLGYDAVVFDVGKTCAEFAGDVGVNEGVADVVADAISGAEFECRGVTGVNLGATFGIAVVVDAGVARAAAVACAVGMERPDIDAVAGDGKGFDAVAVDAK